MAWVEVWVCTYRDNRKSPYEEPVVIVAPTETDCVRQASGRLHFDTGVSIVETWEALQDKMKVIPQTSFQISKPYRETFDPGEVTCS